jgi:hypothetical protein
MAFSTLAPGLLKTYFQIQICKKNNTKKKIIIEKKNYPVEVYLHVEKG